MEEEKRERKTTRRDFLRISGAAALAASVTGFIPALKGKAGKEGNIFSGISYAGERPDYEIYALKYASADYFPGYVLHWMGRPPFAKRGLPEPLHPKTLIFNNISSQGRQREVVIRPPPA